MIDLAGKPGELRFTVEVRRAGSGETETVEFVGTISPDAKDAA